MSPAQSPRDRRPAFTMIELLIAISIMLILLAITAAAIRITSDSDRVRGAGRQIQSYLLGARDRAIYAKAPRGVRFLRGGSGGALGDPTDRANRLVSSMVYIEPTEPWQGQVTIIPFDPTQAWNSSTNQLRRVRLRDTTIIPDWAQLVSRGLLTPGLRMQIPASNRGTWYAIQSIDTNVTYSNNPMGLGNGPFQEIVLTTEYRSANPTGLNYDKASIELPPSVVPNEEPVQLPKGVAIDLDRCGYWSNVLNTSMYSLNTASDPYYWPSKLPASWQGGASSNPPRIEYNQRMDLMFSPRGAITGPPAAQGVIQFYVTDVKNLAGLPTDIKLNSAANSASTYAQLLDPAYGESVQGTVDPPIVDKIITTVFTRTGNVTCSPVRAIDQFNNLNGNSGADGFADDPFYFSERGEVAGR